MMEDILSRPLVLVPVVGLMTILILTRILAPKQDPREPPLAPTSIPYIGHAFGLLWRGFHYYLDLSNKTKCAPILTMLVPSQKMYIINSLTLIQQAQKQHHVLSFLPLQSRVSSILCGNSKLANDILNKNIMCEDGHGGVFGEIHPMMRKTLGIGEGLDGMNRTMVETVAKSLNQLHSGSKIKLNKWMRGVVTSATTDSVYGPQNPFKEKDMVDAFWVFERNLLFILFSFLPSVFSRKGLTAREKVAHGFDEYVRAGGCKNGSMLIQNRYRISSNFGIPDEDIARFEVAMCIAFLVNTTPAMFWIVFFLFSDPKLLAEVREEVAAIVEETTDSNGIITRSLDITKVKSNCPLLTSTFQETLRHRGIISSVRQVMEDTVLDGKWLLKKNALIQMPAYVIHQDPSIWGPDVANFNPRRFMQTPGEKRPSATAFRSFGGGTTLCPGRHFATNEILAVVTMLITRFDLEPVNGAWVMPTSDNTNMAASVMMADTDIEVVVRERFEGGEWTFGMSESKAVFAVTEEDHIA